MANFDVILYFVFAEHKSNCPCCDDTVKMVEGPFITEKQAGEKIHEIKESEEKKKAVSDVMYTDEWEMVVVETTIKEKHSRKVYQ